MLSSLPTTARQRLAVVGLFAAAALTLGACGGSDSTSTVTAPTPTSSTTGSSTTSTTSSTTSSTTDSSTTSTDTSTTSDAQAQFDELLRKNLIQSQGLDSKTADCVIEKLHDSLTESQIQAVLSGQVPKSVTEAAFNAGFQCGSQ
jgi:hypothetical protein